MPDDEQTAEFGQNPYQRRPAGQSKPARLERITAHVAEVRRLASGEFLVTLDNGQVWQQIEIDSRIWPEKGEMLTIRRAALGSFLLATPDDLATRVRRIQ